MLGGNDIDEDIFLASPTPRAMTWTRCTDALTSVGLFAVRVADGLT